jgi:hypothetical protein
MSPSLLSVAVATWKELWQTGAPDDTHAHNITHTTLTTRKRSTKTKQTTNSHTQKRNKNGKKGKPKYCNNKHQQHQLSPTAKTLQQYDLHKRNLDKADLETFGDKLHTPQPLSTLRIGFQNIGNLPASARTAKSRQIVEFITSSQMDVFCMNEVGLHFDLLPANVLWCSCVFGKLKTSSSIFGYNKTERQSTAVLQTGGVGIVATEEVSYRAIKRGIDPTGLGRWAWVLLEGKQHCRTRVITVYRPCNSKGPGTVNQQHQRHFRLSKRTVAPRQALLDDLFTAATAWKQHGDHLAITMDANNDVRTGHVTELFRSLDMKEAILDHHKSCSPQPHSIRTPTEFRSTVSG